jgi:hypothetical protein
LAATCLLSRPWLLKSLTVSSSTVLFFFNKQKNYDMFLCKSAEWAFK